MISVPEKMTLCDLVDKIHIHIYREDRLLIAEGSVYVFATCAQREWNEMCMCVAVVVKCTKIPHGKGHWERQTQQRWWFLYVAVFFIYECLIVYLPFCSWEMYSFDLVPSSRLNHTSSLLIVVMMALHDTQKTTTTTTSVNNRPPVLSDAKDVCDDCVQTHRRTQLLSRKPKSNLLCNAQQASG